MKPVPILLYHSVSDDVSDVFRPFSVSPAQFRDQMEWLTAHQFLPTTVSDWVSAVQDNTDHLLHNPVLVTFDDGFEDFYTNAFPILKELNIPATMYITTGFVGKTSQWLDAHGEGNRPMMTWEQIKTIQQNGIEIGAHTMTHPQLDLLPTPSAQHEITESKRILEEHLNTPIHSFAYPHGYYSQAVRHIAKTSGFTSASAVKNALSHRTDDPYALGRITVLRDMSLDTITTYICGHGLPTATPTQSLKTKGWRIVRHASQRLNLPLGA